MNASPQARGLVALASAAKRQHSHVYLPDLQRVFPPGITNSTINDAQPRRFQWTQIRPFGTAEACEKAKADYIAPHLLQGYREMFDETLLTRCVPAERIYPPATP